MNPQNAELIEVATALLAAGALAVGLWMLERAWETYRAARVAGRCEAIVVLAWLRVRNEAGRAAISASVVYAGVVQIMAPAPPTATANRPIFQAIWLLIAFICLTKSILNERDARRIVTIIERERAAGRMKP